MWGECMTLSKLLKAIEATSLFNIKVMPILREMISHYNDIIRDGELSRRDIEEGEEKIKALNKALGEKQ